MTAQDSVYEWVDYPVPGFFTGPWGWGHTIGCGIATFLYIIPGIIYLIAYAMGDTSYKKRNEAAKENHEIAFKKTGCIYLYSATHKGGHPYVPFGSKLLIGMKRGEILFYTYRLETLHRAPLSTVSVRVKTEQVVSGGASYVTTTNTHTIGWSEVIKGVQINAEFYLGTYSPQEFVQYINELLVEG